VNFADLDVAKAKLTELAETAPETTAFSIHRRESDFSIKTFLSSNRKRRCQFCTEGNVSTHRGFID
jgi:hypothetical protein